jgi:predicted nucleic acid-binding protein
MVIVDSSVWIDALNGRANPETVWLNHALDQEEIGLTTLILCEVLQGIRVDRHFLETRERLSGFPTFICSTVELSLKAAENFRTLQRRGITIRKTIDCFIATFCIESGHQLLHRDGDFGHFETHLGLRVIHPFLSAVN